MNGSRDERATEIDLPAARLRIAAAADLHCTKGSVGKLQPHFAQVRDHADVLLLCGDLTDYGTVEEAHVLVNELAHVGVPIVAVLGNHDCESGHAEEVAAILRASGVTLLDGDACEVQGVGFAGTKGFLGGFGRGTLGFWGESAVKKFVQEAIDEALKLESALARLKTERRVALLHYAPIVGTVLGEPAEIYPFLGCSRLEEPLQRYPVAAVFHGHAHKGTAEGRTADGTPVYNVAMPLLLRTQRGAPPYRVIEV
ncbi:MAG: metallophosphoesterase [Polyangiales bacterium]